MNQFAHSELILNADGSIYHLALFPEQIAENIILVGDPARVQKVSRNLDRVEMQNQKREFIAHTGFLGEKRITVLSTGIGTENIDIVLNELHLLANYDFANNGFKADKKSLKIFRIGTSGALQPDIKIDSFLISEFAIGIDNLLHFYRFINSHEEIHVLEQFKAQCNFHHNIHPYISSASAQLMKYFGSDFLKGITLTCPGFYAPQGRKINAPVSMEKFFKDIMHFRCDKKCITNLEMETSAIYGLSKILGHACISLNAILANRSTGTFSKEPEQTIDKLIKKTLEIIELIED